MAVFPTVGDENNWGPKLQAYIDSKDTAVHAANYGADTSTDATSSLQAAAAAAKAQAGSTLLLTPGHTYSVSAAVDVTGLTVQMSGVTLKAASGVTAPNVLTTTGDLTVIGGIIDGNKANNTAGSGSQSCGIYSNASAWSKIQVTGTRIINCWQVGIKLAKPQGAVTDPSTLPLTPVVLDGVTVTGCGSYGIYLQCLAGVDLRGCTGNSNGPSGIYVNLCRKVNIIGGETTGNATHGTTVVYGVDTQVTGLTANGNTQHGITFGGGTAANSVNRKSGITGCTCSNNTLSGICIDPTLNGSAGVPQIWDGRIIGNTCDNNGQHGIVTTSVSRATINGNNCDTNALSGISLNSSNMCTIVGNTLTNNVNNGLGFNATSAAPSGFYGRHVVGGNVYNGNGADTSASLINAYHQPSSFTQTIYRETFGTAAPTTGTWGVGDHCRNSSMTVGQPKGWYCTVAGTPGTWVSEGNL